MLHRTLQNDGHWSAAWCEDATRDGWHARREGSGNPQRAGIIDEAAAL